MTIARILIVDDSKTQRDIYQQILAEGGYKTETASNGMEELATIRTFKPDVIITDISMPKMDGYKVCGMLKFDKSFSNTPVIILTARAGEADKEMAKDVKADDYITKPFEPSELITKIKKFLKEE